MYLARKFKNVTFEEKLMDKIGRKGLTKEEAINDIYKTAVKTNKKVNKEQGVDE